MEKVTFKPEKIKEMKDKTMANYIQKAELQNFVYTPLCTMPVKFANVLIQNDILSEIDDNGFAFWKDTMAPQRWQRFVDNVKARLFDSYEETISVGKGNKKVLRFRNWFRAGILDIILTFIEQRESFYKYNYSTWSSINAIEISDQLNEQIQTLRDYENKVKNFYKTNDIQLAFRQELFANI